MLEHKYVDMVAASSDSKPLPLGKVETWWNARNEKRSIVKNPEDWNVTNPKELAQKTEYQILLDYSFKGFEFGNWMTQADRHKQFEAFKNSIKNIQKIFGSKNLGFDRQIGVAFGARGSKFPAHYEPSTNIVNITKINGPGSLIHEYAHALDYNIGAFIDQNKNFVSLSGGDMTVPSKLNVGGQYRYLMNVMTNYVRSTKSYLEMREVLSVGQRSYWCNQAEIFARLMEAYFSYTYFDELKDLYLSAAPSVYQNYYNHGYLTKKEIEGIAPTIKKFISEVGLLLNDKASLRNMAYPSDTLPLPVVVKGGKASFVQPKAKSQKKTAAKKTDAKKKTAPKATAKAAKKKTAAKTTAKATKATATGKAKQLLLF